MTHVYLGMGSNQGDRVANLAAGISLLARELDSMVISSVYETEPVGVTDQPLFLNVVVGGETELSPRELLTLAKSIESQVGRRPTFRWGPRVLDIDILMYGYESVDDPDLTVPHRELLNRDFVLIPLCEIAADVILPNGDTPCRNVAGAQHGRSVRLVGPLPGLVSRRSDQGPR